jgi:hypothetical protein
MVAETAQEICADLLTNTVTEGLTAFLQAINVVYRYQTTIPAIRILYNGSLAQGLPGVIVLSYVEVEMAILVVGTLLSRAQKLEFYQVAMNGEVSYTHPQV